MRRMIRGDLRRILRKPGFYVFAVILCFMCLYWTTDTEPSENIDLIYSFVNYGGILMISLPVLLSVYGDELHSGTMQGVIGRGLSRTRLILGKLIDCAVLSALLFFLLYLTIRFKNFFNGYSPYFQTVRYACRISGPGMGKTAYHPWDMRIFHPDMLEHGARDDCGYNTHIYFRARPVRVSGGGSPAFSGCVLLRTHR